MVTGSMVQVGPKSYIQVYTGIYFPPKVYMSMYLDVQTEESIHLDVRKRVFIYHTRYKRVHCGIGFRNDFKYSATRAGLKASESQQLQGTQVQTEGI